MLDPEPLVELRRSAQLQVGLGDVADGERHEPEDVPVQGRHDEIAGLVRELEPALRQRARLVHPALERVDERETAQRERGIEVGALAPVGLDRPLGPRARARPVAEPRVDERGVDEPERILRAAVGPTLDLGGQARERVSRSSVCRASS